MVFSGTDADISHAITFYLPDKEDQAADPLRQRTVIPAHLNDPLVDLAEEYTGINHLRGKCSEQLISGNNGPKVFGCDFCNSVVNYAKLRTKLTVCSGGVYLAEAVFPESSSYRQQGVVVHNVSAVF